MNNEQLRRCQKDIAYFAKKIVGVELWEHQLQFMTSRRKYVVVASARQIGKSTACAIKAIHTAFSKQSKVLVVSPSLRQSGLMFATIRQFIQESEFLRGSLVDDTKTYIKLSNGSELWCLPDSPAQIRGFSKVSCAIVDEANFCSQELLRAVQYSLITVKDSQLFMISSPWTTDHWFYRYFQDGQDKKDPQVDSFHFTYEVSPLIPKETIESMKEKLDEEEYKTEVMGEWVSDEDAFLDYELVQSCIADYPLITPDGVHRAFVWGGVDWAARGRDETVVMFITKINIKDDNGHPTGEQVYVVPYFEAYKKTNYDIVIRRVVELAHKLRILKIVSEMNGVGDMPTQTLEASGLNVEGVFTTSQSKINGYGRLKILMQARKLLIPREPELIKQLTNLRYTLSESGASFSISHSKQYRKDDYSDALMFSLLACKELAYDNTPIQNIEKVKAQLMLNGLVIPADKPYVEERREKSELERVFNFDATEPITKGLLDRDF
jgi:PBSX family phage terminase large subunit